MSADVQTPPFQGMSTPSDDGGGENSETEHREILTQEDSTSVSKEKPSNESQTSMIAPPTLASGSDSCLAVPPGLGLEGDPSARPEDSPTQANVTVEAGKVDPSVQKIITQVEFYFGDANLPTDNFLMKQVRSNPEGWVSLKTILSFRKMKNMKKSLKQVADALQLSSELAVHATGDRVRRIAKLPEVDPVEVQERTVIGENLPPKPTIADMEEIFGKVGKLMMVRICQPNQQQRSTAQAAGGDLNVSNQLHVLVEYATVEEAARAVEELTDSDNWRFGLRVRALARPLSKKKKKAKSKAGKEVKSTARDEAASGHGAASSAPLPANAAEDSGADEQAVAPERVLAASSSVDTEPISLPVPLPASSAAFVACTEEGTEQGTAVGSPPADEEWMATGAGKGRRSARRKFYASWASGSANNSKPQEAPGRGGVEEGPRAPRMPDGTRGFTFGRGKRMAPAIGGS
ncbi:hypothetical protein CYMTET_47490 [Cymbomonas tetramitiformis]|uniref:HTH La-type RNA-binding domain-containing protein n=1 Tax=Cymbomonas tetramitiformis TaxID=36881 RepID=A0AAE0BVG7_9CHLO|nr:hypothetical protein CYMTET_47490 [Cymbomonas tetramitiformis]